NTQGSTEAETDADRLAEPWFGLDQYAWGGEKIEIRTFEVPNGNLDREFNLIARKGDRYQLVNLEDGKVLLDGAVGMLSERQVGKLGPLKLLVSELRARPGTTFSVVRMSRLKAIQVFEQTMEVFETPATQTKEIQSGLIGISLKGPDPKQAAAIVNEIVNVYLRQDTGRSRAEAEVVLNLVRQQLTSVRNKVTNAENTLNNYRLQHGTADLNLETQTLLEKIVSVETTISQLKRDRQEQIMQSSPWREGFRKLTPQHNQVTVLDAQIASLNNELEGLRGRVTRLQGTQQEILRLSRDLEVHSGLYTSLLNKAQELEVAAGGPASNIDVIDYADIPVEAVEPMVGLEFVVAVALGLLLGVVAAALRWNLNEGIEDPDVIEKRLGLPIYAVPHTRQQQRVTQNAQREEGTPAVLVAVNPQDIATESLRSLRTSLNFAMFDSNHKTIMITSSAPGVGKTFIAANLAAVLASTGKRTLVIDADLRKGYIHQCLGIERGVGLSDAIAGSQGLIELAIHKTKIEGIDVITSGTIPPNPSELLMHEKFGLILQEASSRYDYTIVDTPPILAVTDAAVIGRMMDVTLFVVKAGMQPLREIEEAAKRLRQAGVHLSGVVFNGFEVSNSRHKYGRYSAYTHAYSKTK
ncbi:MAG: polysaccharide biosynthesis tyrosine autokinase, partial [Gammaproteobacteria bacterium]